MSRVLVTGGNGFVGQSLCPALINAGYQVRISTRISEKITSDQNIDSLSTGDIGPETDWTWALDNVDMIVHLAGRAHVMRETAADPLAAFRETNVEGTIKLAEAAVRKGIKRFVFISSVKAVGEQTYDHPFQETEPPAPEDAYGQSKWEAEQALSETVKGTGLETVILRPPLIYGPHVKGNFETLLSVCSKNIPLPLRAVTNQRSLIFVGNLTDAILKCLAHDKAAGETFFVRDDGNPSTAELICAIAEAFGVPARLLPVPPALLRLGGRLTGRSAMIRRLTESLVIDDGKIRSLLGWRPPHSMVEGMAQTTSWYQSMRSNG